jgi:hypothetical protein
LVPDGELSNNLLALKALIANRYWHHMNDSHTFIGMFPSATFCVFSNRFLAIIVAAMCCWWWHGTVLSSAPLLYFTPCAIRFVITF